MKSKALTVDDIKKAMAPVLERGGARRAILFGSYARGDADQWSDIDLIIIAESKRPFIERFKDFGGLRQVSPVKALDIIVYTPDEFERMQGEENPFVSRAVEEGEVIYEARSEKGSGPVATPGRERPGRK